MTRKTINNWRNRSAEFQAELNRLRKEQWHAATERLRSLAGRAVEVLEDDLRGDDPKARREAALHVLRAVKLYGTDLEPDGPTTAEEMRTQRMLIAAGKMLVQVLAAVERTEGQGVGRPAGQLSALSSPRPERDTRLGTQRLCSQLGAGLGHEDDGEGA